MGSLGRSGLYKYILFFTAGLLVGCGQPTALTATTASSLSSTSTASLSPASVTVAPGGSADFTVLQGTAPYTFTLISTIGGTIDPSTGHFVAGATQGTLQIQVQDFHHNYAYASVVVDNGSNTTGTSNTVNNCNATSANSLVAGQLYCMPTEAMTGQNATCDTGQVVTSLIASGVQGNCGSVQHLWLSVQCCMVRAKGSSYTRTITATGNTHLELYCGPGESPSIQLSNCNGVGNGTSASTSPDGHPGFTMDCPQAAGATLVLSCNGTAN